MEDKDGDIGISNTGFLPIVSAYAARIGLVEEIDRLLHCQMEVSPGRVVLALILDALSGRSALFRLEQFFKDKDVEHLLGEDIPRSSSTMTRWAVCWIGCPMRVATPCWGVWRSG